ncbi:DUF423 domain-containing protein [Sneathiella glossodoripedis]|uniref:DUF423 domain-containing protein n=1 Tax=Sneathiella glossodoripedis TaxID=418853 RepID=UPI000472F775|nr:DUF423 domain-containing protein [Sneathiella glossodoripedis]
MPINWIFIACILGAMAVISGAIGAHITVGNGAAKSFHDTALVYHMFSVVPLIACGYLSNRSGGHNFWVTLSASLCLVGAVFFCGSLYWLAWTGEGLGFNIAPIGGVLMIAGWIVLAIASVKTRLL